MGGCGMRIADQSLSRLRSSWDVVGQSNRWVSAASSAPAQTSSKTRPALEMPHRSDCLSCSWSSSPHSATRPCSTATTGCSSGETRRQTHTRHDSFAKRSPGRKELVAECRKKHGPRPERFFACSIVSARQADLGYVVPEPDDKRYNVRLGHHLRKLGLAYTCRGCFAHY